MKTLVLLAMLHCMLLLNAQPKNLNPIAFSRISIEIPDDTVIDKLQRAGIDLHCGGHFTMHEGERALELDCSPQELASIQSEDIGYQILIKDVGRFYSSRSESHLEMAKATLEVQKQKSAGRSVNSESCTSPRYSVPVNFFLGEMGGFLYYQQILDVLDSMARAFPQLITSRVPLSDTISTRQGRPVYMVKISDHPGEDEAEPEVLYTALTHAREPASTMSLLYYMWYLLENYETDLDVRRIVDHTELFFVPVVNPDGYVYNAITSPEGGGMWRKNMHDNDGNDFIDGKDGVDLNRNFGYLWGLDDIGSSPHPSLNTYRGDTAFSEPESRMVRDFVLQHEFVTAMHDHSYGNDLYHAWEHGPSHLPDADILYRLSDQMTWHNRYLFGESYNTYWLGEINGGANDWFYGEQTQKPKIFSWLAEIGGQFWPDPLDIQQICNDQLEPHLLTAMYAGQQADIHLLNPAVLNIGLNQLSFRIENLGLKAGNMHISLVPVGKGIASHTIEGTGEITFREPLESSIVNVSIVIDHQIPDGNLIAFDLVLEGDEYTIARNRYAMHINPVAILRAEVAGNLQQWSTDFWGLQSDLLDSSSVWLTDTPYGDQLDDFNTIRLNEKLDLSDVSWAKATFMAHWNIETTHDYIQFQVRTPDQEWVSLCGKYSKTGALGNLIDIPSPHAGQRVGEPVYDGRQTEWILEEVDLTDYVGSDSVEIRFVAWSGGTVSSIVEDGFYFSEFQGLTSLKLHCSNQLLDNDEVGIDCGGIDCEECPSCGDGLQNGDEEGVDCGGIMCAPCPSCADGIENNDEEGVDCGGECAPCPSCVDGVQNGDETAIDCGGKCSPCEPTCSDGIWNGDEENIDCGGSCPNECRTRCCERDDKLWHGDQVLSVRISPNPVQNNLHVFVEEVDDIQATFMLRWEIIDVHGDVLRRGEFTDKNVTLVVSDLHPTIYILRILDPQDGVHVLRFVKT